MAVSWQYEYAVQQWQVARDEKAQYGLAVVATAMTHFGETARMTMPCSARRRSGYCQAGLCEEAQWLLQGICEKAQWL